MRPFMRKVEERERYLSNDVAENERVVGALVSSAQRNPQALGTSATTRFSIYRSGQVSTADSSGQVCACLFKALLQRLGVTGSAR